MNTFAIKMPKHALGHPEGFYAWLNSHLANSVPVSKTNFRVSNLEDLYKKVVSEANRVTSYEYVNAQFFMFDKAGIDQGEYANWLMTQNMMVLVTEVGPGVYKLNFVNYGRDHTKDVNKSAHKPIIVLYCSLWFDNKDYSIQFAEELTGLEEYQVGRPIQALPVVDYRYEQTKEVQLNCEELVEAAMVEFHRGIPALEIVGAAGLEMEMLKVVKNAFDYRGGFFKPLRFSFSVSEVPVQEGTKYYPVVSFSLGQTFTTVLSPFIIGE